MISGLASLIPTDSLSHVRAWWIVSWRIWDLGRLARRGPLTRLVTGLPGQRWMCPAQSRQRSDPTETVSTVVRRRAQKTGSPQS